jgi:hypothetical protein
VGRATSVSESDKLNEIRRLIRIWDVPNGGTRGLGAKARDITTIDTVVVLKAPPHIIHSVQFSRLSVRSVQFSPVQFNPIASRTHNLILADDDDER